MASLPFPIAFDDPNLFGPFFRGPSWNSWRAVLRAIYAMPLDAEQLAFFRKVAERDPPKRRVREVWLICGRRSGKDSVASAMGTYAALQPYEGLRPGENPAIMCLAVDRAQARIVTRYMQGYFREIKLLDGLVERETQDGLELTSGAEISVMVNSFRAVRGRTVAFAVLDECAFYRSDESANPDSAVYDALVPGMSTIDDSMMAGITSPHKYSGLVADKHRASYGKNDDDVLVIKAATWLMNPSLPQRVIDAAFERIPAVARAEYGAEFRDDLSTFLEREIVEAAVDRGITVRPPIPGVQYIGFADSSSGRGDAYTAGVSHLEDSGVIVLDCLMTIQPPFNPGEATARVAAMLREYRITRVTADRYAVGFVAEAFAANGIEYRPSLLDRSEIYAESIPLFTAGRVRLLDNTRLVSQLCALERRTMPGGRDRIDHPTNGHDDAANSAAGAIVHAALEGRRPKVPFVIPQIFALSGTGAPEQFADRRPQGFTRKPAATGFWPN